MKNNQQKEFIKLYDPIHNQLFGFCRAISGNVQDAEDLMQDTVLTAIEGFKKLRDKSAFKSYLFSVACNLNKMKARRKKFRAEFNKQELMQLSDSSKNPESLVDFQIIHEKMLKLPARMAETLVLFHICDMSLEDISKIQGGSLSGVKLRLKRGRKKLLSMLNSPSEMKKALLFLTI
ncbi:sigma-70 family RNA polymerase sigma factor [Fulvivirgaceae bacterium BMA12]|uniref:Sigma-70 family RNA polymerase sigma factor n=1 Tax=Agaribacillus aureus TaxID=3051825 RepID=A0ABT8LAF7_9BACT|nr:sigma-70 family RNA polymerase sigma factor [Fulvivirgaceae bacterium BMA12]